MRRLQDDGLQLDHRGDGAPGWCLQVENVQLEAVIDFFGRCQVVLCSFMPFPGGEVA